MRLGAGLAVVALLATTGCGSEEPRVRVDCFSASPQQAPTRAEVEHFARVQIPPTARGLRTSCVGFMDTFLRASFVLPRSQLRRFLARGGFRSAAAEDRRGGVYRRLKVRRAGAGQVAVYLKAFTT